ncbi:conserved hypothetical protein, partial [Ricinus communis]
MEQGQQQAHADEGQRHHDVQHAPLPAPGPHRPRGERPRRPEEPDADAEEELDRGPARPVQLQPVPAQPGVQRLLVVRSQQLGRRQPQRGDGGADGDHRAEVAQRADGRLRQEARAGEQGQHQEHRRDPAARQRQQADRQAAEGGIAQRRRFHVAHGAVQQQRGQRHLQRFRRGFVAVQQQAEAAEVDQHGRVGQRAAEVVRLGLAAEGQAQRLRVLAAAEVEGG